MVVDRYYNALLSTICMNDEDVFPGRIAQLVKAWICIRRIAGSSLTAGGVFFRYGPLTSLSVQIASVGSDYHGKKWRSQPVD